MCVGTPFLGSQAGNTALTSVISLQCRKLEPSKILNFVVSYNLASIVRNVTCASRLDCYV